ncbi:hypothetical protein ACFPRL_01920 [Pseudoclavibacter helvolus]
MSNASDDLPDPERPVNTTRLSRGISRSTFLRLCTRAPWTRSCEEGGRTAIALSGSLFVWMLCAPEFCGRPWSALGDVPGTFHGPQVLLEC